MTSVETNESLCLVIHMFLGFELQLAYVYHGKCPQSNFST